ncbi:MAG TPA: 50S ribosomal protein L11 methyltransferase, partial [Rhizobiaceae bacterium]|nr:50S ribosomal protein L11 methyltransferase [Rhizobiaceae bacterium]
MKPLGYSVGAYGDMITDAVRMDAYDAALRSAVGPGSTVIDIGAGTGIFSLLACRYGAACVIAVEPDSAIEVARASAAANGCADRIQFFQGVSTDLKIEQPADVIVSDLRGILPLLQFHIPSIIDARERLLKAGGSLVPQRDRIWATIVEAPKIYEPFASPWQSNPFDLDLSAGHPHVVNQWMKAQLRPEQFLAVPQVLADLDYRTITNPNMANDIEWSAIRNGVVHGLCLWFDTELLGEIGFSNAPGRPEAIYGQAFFPMEKSVAVGQGDRVEARVRADLLDGDYVWSWNTRFHRAGEPQPHVSFDQSTFRSLVLSPSALKHRSSGHVPALTKQAQIDIFCLSKFGGT